MRNTSPCDSKLVSIGKHGLRRLTKYSLSIHSAHSQTNITLPLYSVFGIRDHIGSLSINPAYKESLKLDKLNVK